MLKIGNISEYQKIYQNIHLKVGSIKRTNGEMSKMV